MFFCEFSCACWSMHGINKFSLHWVNAEMHSADTESTQNARIIGEFSCARWLNAWLCLCKFGLHWVNAEMHSADTESMRNARIIGEFSCSRWLNAWLCKFSLHWVNAEMHSADNGSTRNAGIIGEFSCARWLNADYVNSAYTQSTRKCIQQILSQRGMLELLAYCIQSYYIIYSRVDLVCREPAALTQWQGKLIPRSLSLFREDSV
jgi:hypothetical protein